MNKALDQVMQRQMSRKEFLFVLGLGIASIFGFGHAIEIFTGHSLNRQLGSGSIESPSLGSTGYGGK